jgi:hypothetical protein
MNGKSLYLSTVALLITITTSASTIGADSLTVVNPGPVKSLDAPGPARSIDIPDSIQSMTVEPTGGILGLGELREPLGLAVDDRGFLFVADAMTGKVFRYSPDGSSLEFEKPGSDAAIYPIDIAAYGTFIYVLDYSGNRVLRYDYKGAFIDVLLDFSAYERMKPVSISTSGSGRLVTTDMVNHTLTVWSPLLEVEIVKGEYGWLKGSLDRPVKGSLFGDDMIAVAEFGNRRVQIFSGSGSFERFLELPGDGEMGAPRYLCSDPEGRLFVADPEAGAVHIYSADMGYIRSITGGEKDFSPSAVAADWNGHLYISDLTSKSVIVFRLTLPGD